MCADEVTRIYRAAMEVGDTELSSAIEARLLRIDERPSTLVRYAEVALDADELPRAHRWLDRADAAARPINKDTASLEQAWTRYERALGEG